MYADVMTITQLLINYILINPGSSPSSSVINTVDNSMVAVEGVGEQSSSGAVSTTLVIVISVVGVVIILLLLVMIVGILGCVITQRRMKGEGGCTLLYNQ